MGGAFLVALLGASFLVAGGASFLVAGFDFGFDFFARASITGGTVTALERRHMSSPNQNDLPQTTSKKITTCQGTVPET